MSTDTPQESSAPSKHSPELPAALSEALVDFKARCDAQGDDTPWVWRYNGGGDFHLGASVLVHGDETGPLLGLLDVMEALESGKLPFVGRFTCFVGNPRAAHQGVRFTEEDLNRVFVSSQDDAQDDKSSYERGRAQALMPLLDELDLYIDFHQTILPVAQPFYICPWSVQGWRWARLMGGAKVWVTRHPQRGGGGLACADAWVAARGKPSLALELGERGLSPEARAAVWRSLSRAFQAINTLSAPQPQEPHLSLKELAEQRPDLEFFETAARVPMSDPHAALKAGLVNFMPVEQGQRLSSASSPVELLAPLSGALLFPKYPPRDDSGAALSPAPSELFRVVTRLDKHPTELWADVTS